ncbi:hypothetical protein [Odoribacter laneus]|uniref:hypothetical protein n=1 Tax=Odoribacter laneus TaxID=626933 RepID=UPI00164EAD59|nr:hypothetical protein [Odoribacter laneus]
MSKFVIPSCIGSNCLEFACYCEIALFEYTSGITIRKETRMPVLANRKRKVHLTRTTIIAMSWDLHN